MRGSREGREGIVVNRGAKNMLLLPSRSTLPSIPSVHLRENSCKLRLNKHNLATLRHLFRRHEKFEYQVQAAVACISLFLARLPWARNVRNTKLRSHMILRGIDDLSLEYLWEQKSSTISKTLLRTFRVVYLTIN